MTAAKTRIRTNEASVRTFDLAFMCGHHNVAAGRGLGGRVHAPVQLVDIVFPPTQAILKNDVAMSWKWSKTTHRQMAQRLAQDSNRVDAPFWTPPDPSLYVLPPPPVYRVPSTESGEHSR